MTRAGARTLGSCVTHLCCSKEHCYTSSVQTASGAGTLKPSASGCAANGRDKNQVNLIRVGQTGRVKHSETH